MQNKKSTSFILFLVFLFSGIACQLFTPATTTPFEIGKPTTAPVKPATPLPAIAVMPSSDNPDEPVFISGLIPYSSPFFVNSIAEPFVMLEDQAGFVRRDKDFEFRLESQVIGPVENVEEGALSYYLSLPAVPQGTFVDVDQDGGDDTGVQVFAVAYWSNTWGDPFLETRDGTGWSNAYASTTTDAENDYEINGGFLIVWAPDANQEFPSGFGADGLLFTADDPTTAIPAGYNLVDLNEEPFGFSKENHLQIDLIEGDSATNNYSDLDYEDAFKRMFEKVAREYPFTKEKGIDWNNLEQTFYPRAEKANDDIEFFQLVRDFSFEFPDGHANVSFNADVFYQEYGEGFGLLITELSDGRFIASEVLPDYPAYEAGIQPGAEIVTWDDKPVSEAVTGVIPGFGPYSTDHTRRIAQTSFLTRVQPGSQVAVSFKNPGSQSVQKATLKSASEYETVFRQIASFNQDQLSLPVEGHVLPETGLGYIKIQTFGADYNLMARLWEHYITSLLEEEIPGLVIDLRENSGGSLGLALDFAGYFFEDEIELYTSSYYNEKSGEFEPVKYPATIRPAPMLYEGPIVVLVGPDCISACEGFAHALSSEQRSILVGHYPSAGAFGEVGRGQYELPDGISLQFPTGRPVTTGGDVLIEGNGVSPDVVVPVTLESALGEVDAVLAQAIKTLQELID